MTQEDLDKLYKDYYINSSVSDIDWKDNKESYQAGFKKALELVLEDNIHKLIDATDGFYSHDSARVYVLGLMMNKFSSLL